MGDELIRIYSGQVDIDTGLANMQNIVDTETAKKLAGD